MIGEYKSRNHECKFPSDHRMCTYTINTLQIWLLNTLQIWLFIVLSIILLYRVTSKEMYSSEHATQGDYSSWVCVCHGLSEEAYTRGVTLQEDQTYAGWTRRSWQN